MSMTEFEKRTAQIVEELNKLQEERSNSAHAVQTINRVLVRDGLDLTMLSEPERHAWARLVSRVIAHAVVPDASKRTPYHHEPTGFATLGEYAKLFYEDAWTVTLDDVVAVGALYTYLKKRYDDEHLLVDHPVGEGIVVLEAPIKFVLNEVEIAGFVDDGKIVKEPVDGTP